MLERDITVYTGNAASFDQEQIQLNSGLVLANNSQYYPNALIPKSDWKKINSEEYSEILRYNAKDPAHKVIAIFSIPSYCFRKLIDAQFYTLKFEQDVVDFQTRKDYQELIFPIVNYIDENLKITGDLVIPPLGMKKPGLITVSSDQLENGERQVGLHVDTWDRKNLSDLKNARNRICINLGNQSRFFLFVNLSMEKICNMLVDKTNESIEKLFFQHQLLNEFVKYYPLYPVVRLELRPNQAYIAPTENIFHDGSTFGTTSLDIHLTIRGKLRTILNQDEMQCV